MACLKTDGLKLENEGTEGMYVCNVTGATHPRLTHHINPLNYFEMKNGRVVQETQFAFPESPAHLKGAN